MSIQDSQGSEPGNGHYDLVVIGGGINGTGIARDAAGRGLSVLLCEQDDLGRFTSSASSKLIHGGLRYLEHYDFRLVRHSLEEREVLLRSAPHIIWPLRFILPHHSALRPRWLIRLGLFIYDHLGKRKLLPASHSVDLTSHTAGTSLNPSFTSGFEYSDCWVQDSRLVVLNAMDAADRGAKVLTHTRCVGLDRATDWWSVSLERTADGERSRVYARSVVNAAGPWVEQVAGLDPASRSANGVRLVKGSHIIVPALFDHQYVYLFQNSDDRIMFAIPYERDFTLLGTTDVEISGDPAAARASDEEIAYICENASNYFRKSVDPAEVVYSYSGVRPLFDDAAANASKTTRDYVLHLDAKGPPIVAVYGGKLTTYRKLGEQVLDMLSRPLGISEKPWTATAALPGGDFDAVDFPGFVSRCQNRYPWCDPQLVYYFARNYGTRIDRILSCAACVADLGRHFGDTLYEAEVRYLVRSEWAHSAEDILYRRTKAGLHCSDEEAENLKIWLAENLAEITPEGPNG